MNKFDVLHLVSSLQIGGAERFVVDIAIEQKSTGLSVGILSFASEHDPLVDVALKHGIPVLFIQKKWWSRNRQLLSLISQAKILHCHALSVLRTLLVVMPFIKRRRLIFTRHGEMDIDHWKMKLVYLLSKPFVGIIAFVSSTGRDKFIKQANWHGKAAFVVENGINTKSICKQDLMVSEGKQLRFGCVGRLVPLKAQHHLMEAIELLPKELQQTCSVQIIGDGESREFLERQAKERLKASSYDFHGMLVNRKDIFNNIDILVVNSETEGLSIAILEAMAYEIPVIATKVGGNPRLVKPNKTGWLYDYADIGSLSIIIQNILKEHESLVVLGRGARSYVEQHFSMINTVDTYNQLYQKL